VRFVLTRSANKDVEIVNAELVSVGPLMLFSTETGNAWLLDPTDHLAARVARDGDPEVKFRTLDHLMRLKARVDNGAVAFHDGRGGIDCGRRLRPDYSL
jgi:hypothetical protein